MEVLEGNLVLGLGEVEALQIGAVNGLIALVGQRNIYRVLVEPGEYEGVELLALLLVGGDHDLCNGLVDLRLVL